MSIKVGINGFGRIGRNAVRAGPDNPEHRICGCERPDGYGDDRAPVGHDSTLGRLDADVEVQGDTIVVGGKKIKVFATKDPGEIDWPGIGAEVVVESTGRFTEAKDAAKIAGAENWRWATHRHHQGEDVTIVLGVNDSAYDKSKHHIVSNASCTTNCLAPVAKVLHESFGIEKGSMTTIHSYTNDQNVLDFPHKDLRWNPRRGAQHDPDHNRSGEGDFVGHSGAERQARRLFHARSDT